MNYVEISGIFFVGMYCEISGEIVGGISGMPKNCFGQVSGEIQTWIA